MKRSREIVESRRGKVLQALRDNGLVKVQALAEELEVSPLTIRRDLQYLEDRNKLERFYGGATTVNHIPGGDAEQDEVQMYQQRIAAYAATLVDNGDTIFINTSATALQMIRYIKNKRITVITNNGKAIYAEHPSKITVVLSGGELCEDEGAMVGEFASNNINKVTAKKSFIGCTGLSAELGMTTEIFSEVRIDQLMHDRVTDTSYILADHTKLGKSSNFVSCPVSAITNIITDEKAPKEIVDKFRKRGINVIMIRENGKPVE